ncbi:MAG: DUF4097 domain-containing protein [Lysobacterales bacterium]
MMKAINMCVVAITAAASLPARGADWVEQSDQWEQAFPVSTETPTLKIENIWGDVHVRTGAVDQIRVSVSEHRRAPTQALFDRSLEVLPLTLEADAQGVSLVVGERNHFRRENPCRGCQLDVQFDVTIPPGSRIEVSTVNDGDVVVEGVIGLVSARNVNGPVKVTGAQHCGRLKSINGAVRVTLDQPPSKDCELETINGDITLNIPAGSDIDLALDLFNGKLRSEFEVESMALTPQVEKSRKGKRLRYKISQADGLRIGNGGPSFSVKSLNGNIKINKI